MDHYSIMNDHRGWYVALNGEMRCACTTKADVESKLAQFQYWARLFDQHETFKANDTAEAC